MDQSDIDAWLILLWTVSLTNIWIEIFEPKGQKNLRGARVNFDEPLTLSTHNSSAWAPIACIVLLQREPYI